MLSYRLWSLWESALLRYLSGKRKRARLLVRVAPETRYKHLMSFLNRFLHGFITFNRRLCDRIEPSLPQIRKNPFFLYEQAVAKIIAENSPKLTLDIGGGRSCSFSRLDGASRCTRILAVDVSEDEIRANSDVDEKVVADVVAGLPLRESSVDLIASSSVLEHLRDTKSFFQVASRVLKKHGYFIHVFTCKFAPFALVNQLLPTAFSHRLISFLRPDKQGVCGFPAVYDGCYYSRIRALLLRNGFQVIALQPTFYQSRYFDFIFPCYLLSVLYEVLVSSLGLNNLCAYLLVVARKSGENGSSDDIGLRNDLPGSPDSQPLG